MSPSVRGWSIGASTDDGFVICIVGTFVLLIPIASIDV